ncbi:MAG TPA: TonB-dependent receptor [Bryobacteraceae bacterium]|nr:TonB-dependent receptor [Bryobacteraceae bacterium]
MRNPLRLTFVFLALAVAAHAQSITGSVVGSVTDASGARVGNCTVTLTDLRTSQDQTLRSPDGEFLFPLLKPGRYRLSADAPGFRRSAREFTLEVDQRARLDLVLEVGAVQETVTVTAGAVVLESETSSLGQVISNRQVVDLPLNGRNPFALAALAPGVQPLQTFGGGLTAGRGAAIAAASNNFTANGGVTGGNEILLDGIPITVCCQGQPAVVPNVDVTQEFKVQTNVSQAEFGRTSGAIFNFVSKSGSNDFHGSAFEFLRNEQLDATNFFANRAGRPPIPGRTDFRPPLRYNQFGFTIGGPVLVPYVYNGRNKTFFFGGYEGVRLRRSLFSTFSVPTAAMRQGDFSASPADLFDPLSAQPNPGGGFTRTPFPGRQIPSQRFNNVALNMLKLYPLPIRSGIVNNYDAVASSQDNDDQGNVRLDHYFSDRLRTFARFSMVNNFDAQPNYWNSIATPGAFTQAITGKVFGWDTVYNLSANKLLDLRYGFAWQTNYREPLGVHVDLVGLGLPATLVSQMQARYLPVLNITGFNGPDQNTNQAWSRYTHILAASMTWLAGGHTVKFGWDGRMFRDHNAAVQNTSGSYTFSGSFLNGPNPNAALPAGAAPYLAFGSFLMGLPSDGSIGLRDATSIQQFYHAFYLQDDWKVTPRLTLNLGLRLDFETGVTERFNRLSVIDPSAPNPLAQQTGLNFTGAVRFVGQGGLPRSAWKTNYTWNPRVGMAFQVDAKTVLRGGYGIFVVPTLTRMFLTGFPGFSTSTTLLATVDGINPVASLSNPFPSGLVPLQGASQGPLTAVGSSVSGSIYNNPASYVQQFNFDVQRQLPGSLYVDIAYAGSSGVDIPLNLPYNDLNPAYFGKPGDAATVSYLQQLVPNPFFGRISTGPLSTAQVQRQLLLRQYPQFTAFTANALSAGHTSYHSLQARAQWRPRSSVTLLASYTWSKSLGNVNQLVTNYLDPAVANYQDNFNLRLEKSLMPTDIPQRLVLSGVWDLPFGKGKAVGRDAGRFVNAFIGGWQVNGVLTAQSGFPLVLGVAGAPPFAGNRPSRVAGQQAATSGGILDRLGPPSSTQRYLNNAAFVVPQSFQFGDVPRALSDARRQGLFNLDFSAFKNWSMGERWSLQFRAEAFNLTNTVQFGAPGQTFNTPGFGVIGSQYNFPRQVQLGMKILW